MQNNLPERCDNESEWKAVYESEGFVDFWNVITESLRVKKEIQVFNLYEFSKEYDAKRSF